MQLSASQTTVLRTHPQSTELSLAIFQPRTVLACSISGSYSRGARTLSYTTVTSGSYLSVEAGMTLLAGTTPGGRELGKVRVKSITSSTIEVAENSHIKWQNVVYLTILRYWEVWPVFPRIIPDPNNNEDVIFYKDYDIAYSNQNTILGAFPCAGSHRAGYVGDRFYWSATGTSHLASSALSYNWAFEGGSVTGSTSLTPGWVTYNTAGDYVTRLVVTGANGSVDTTYRYVSIRERPYTSASNQPIKNWSLMGLSGSRGEGGYTATIEITNENISINDGDVVVIWADDWYGTDHTSIGGNGENNSSIFFTGHVLDGSIRFNYNTSTVSFQVGSITETMKRSEGFSISVESKASPSKWFELLDMDGQRALYHYLRWHSTVLSLADFQFIGTDKKIQFFDSDRQSIFDAVDNYMRGTLLGNFSSDRQGKLWATLDPVAYDLPITSFPAIFSMDKQDWIGEPNITEIMVNPVSSIELGGVAYSGTSTGTYSAHIASAPGVTPNVRGSAETVQGLAITGQAQLNLIVGNVYADKVSRYPTIDFGLNGNYRNFDISPIDSVDVNISASDTNRGINLSAPYYVEAMSWEYNSLNKTLFASTTMKSIVAGTSGQTVTIPDIPDDGGYGDGNFGGGFSFGGFPPFLSSLGSRDIWQGTGWFSGELSNTPFQVTGTVAFTGSSYVDIPGGFPQIMVNGWYHVNLEIKATSGSGANIVDVYPNNAGGLSVAMMTRHTFAINVTNGDANKVISSYMYITAGDFLIVTLLGGSVSTGVFVLSIIKET